MPDFQRIIPALFGWREANLLIPFDAFAFSGAYAVKCMFGVVGESNGPVSEPIQRHNLPCQLSMTY